MRDLQQLDRLNGAAHEQGSSVDKLVLAAGYRNFCVETHLADFGLICFDLVIGHYFLIDC